MQNCLKGIKLNEAQHNLLLENMQAIFTEDEYTHITKWFNYILRSRACFKVLLSQDSFNLFYLYYQGNHTEEIKSRDALYSELTLLAAAPKIVEYYLTMGFIPSMLLADTVLVHGTSISLFLDALIEKIYQLLKDTKVQKERSEIETMILGATTIITIAQSDRILLMKPAYFRCCLKSRYELHTLEACKWHRLSANISKLIQECSFQSTAYSLSAVIPDSSKSVHEGVESAAIECRFVKQAGEESDKHDYFVRPLNRGNSAFCIVDVKKHSILNKYIITSAILSDIKLDHCKSLFRRLFSSDIEQKLKYDSPLCAQLLYLTLNYNVLLLLSQSDPRIFGSTPCIDIDNIILSLGTNSVYAAAFMQLIKHKTPYLSWDELEKLTNIDTKPCASLTRRALYTQDTFEEIIARDSEHEELNLYNNFINRKLKIVCHEEKPLGTLFEGSKQVAVDIFRQMSANAILLNINIAIDSDDYEVVYLVGEQSQFIHPKKYADYIPLLIQIERDCNSNQLEIQKRVASFYDYDVELARKLVDYVAYLYSSGQRLRDWDLNWNKYIGIKEQTFTKYKHMDLSDNHLLFIQSLSDRQSQLQELERYKSIYSANA